MDSNIVAQLTPYAWLAIMVASGALGLVTLFRIVDEIERRHRPKPRGRRP